MKITISAMLVAILGDEEEPHGPAHGGRVLDHVGEQLPEELLVELVDRVVREADAERQLGVLAHEGVEAPAEHVARHVGHARDVDVGLDRQLAGELDGPLGDVSRHVADALQVGGDLERRGDEAEVARRGLAEREQLEREVVDLDVEAVHGVVALDGGARERLVALNEGLHRPPDLLLHQPAHLEHRGAQLAELLLVGPVGVERHQPNRPVM